MAVWMGEHCSAACGAAIHSESSEGRRVAPRQPTRSLAKFQSRAISTELRRHASVPVCDSVGRIGKDGEEIVSRHYGDAQAYEQRAPVRASRLPRPLRFSGRCRLQATTGLGMVRHGRHDPPVRELQADIGAALLPVS